MYSLYEIWEGAVDDDHEPETCQNSYTCNPRGGMKCVADPKKESVLILLLCKHLPFNGRCFLFWGYLPVLVFSVRYEEIK